MLVFIDESGDSGMNQKQGSSKFFTVALVVFEDKEEAIACDRSIDELKRKLDWRQNSEFHFKVNSNKVREMFLRSIAKYNFFYYGIVINKNPKKLWGEGFKDKSSFYKYTCGLVFQNASQQLQNSTVIIDQTGSLDFKRQLGTYLRRKMNYDKTKVIRKVKMQRSESNNLLQLADYVAGSINRSLSERKKHYNVFRKLISHREIRVQIWPPV
ncbi:DUF3800 domain-containing protein [Patescibacteria group bacterium]|nr:DUF3800 domain-containing protein [Patescibacteria group bacterium]